MSKSRFLPPGMVPRVEPRAISHEDELDLSRDVHDEYVDEQYESSDFDPFQLDAPEARPGYVQRWVRVELEGRSDINTNSSIRDGWRPRTDLPEKYKPINYSFNTPAEKVDYLKVGDLVLMEKPIRLHQKRMRYYANRDRQIMQTIDAELDAAQVKNHPILRERATREKVGRRDIPNVTRDVIDTNVDEVEDM